MGGSDASVQACIHGAAFSDNGGLSAFVTTFNTLDLKFLRLGEDVAYPYTFFKSWWSFGRQVVSTEVPFNCSIKIASTTTTMAWAPYHYISGLLIPALVWYKVICQKTFHSVPIVVCAGLIWSPFVLLGLVLLVLYGIRRNFREVFSWVSVMPVIASLPFLVYYGAHMPSKTLVAGYLWDCGSTWWFSYLSFLMIEVGVFAALIFLNRDRYLSADDLLVVKINLVPLAIIPLIYLGFYNDFPIKTAIAPLLFVVFPFVKVVCGVLFEIRHSEARLFSMRKLISVFTLFVWCVSTITPLNISLHPFFPHPLYNSKTRIAQPFASDTIRDLTDTFQSAQFLGDATNAGYMTIFKQRGDSNKEENYPGIKADD